MDPASYDVLVLPRLGLETREERAAFFQDMRDLNKKVVLDIDDDLFNMPAHNPSANTPSQLESLEDVARAVDMITVSTRHLAKQLAPYNDNIKVLPNCIDPCLWRFDKHKIRLVKGLTVGVRGGHSHYHDWALLPAVLTRVAEICPEVTFVIAGYHPDYIEDLRKKLGERVFLLGWVPLEHYPGAIAQMDVGLCPLVDDLFNRSKSILSVLEYGILGTPVVASPTVYQEAVQHGMDGFLARTEDEWVRYIVKLVEKQKLRRQMGAALRGKVLAHHNIHKEAWRWMAAYDSLTRA